MNDDRERYCRDVEAYLCRKNEGHLVRIVGPAFEQVCGWAAQGVPLAIVCRGIDRYVERYYAKGPRRRPVRIEFCEADVLDLFDEWRRSVGVAASVPSPPDGDEADSGPARRESLASHLERVVARLTAMRAGADRVLDAVVDAVVRELDGARAGARTLRGERRDALLARLHVIDGQLLESARASCDAATLQRLAAEATAQLAPFRSRMAADVYARSHGACVDRLVRDHARLPTVAFD